MGLMSGWGLTGRLVSKHFGVLGDKVAEAIAAFDPETATEADRDRLQATLRETAIKLAQARAAFDKEHAEVEHLRALIAQDEQVAEKLAAKLTSGEVTEAAVTAFCDELEANKAKLPQEIQEEADAKQYMDELQQIVDAMSKQLADFDNAAKKAMQQMQSAQAQKDLQELRVQRQEELNSLKGLGSNSSALSALTKKAQSVSAEAQGMKIVADIGQKPIDQAAEIEALRKSVSQGAAETPAERLLRLAGKAKEATAA